MKETGKVKNPRFERIGLIIACIAILAAFLYKAVAGDISLLSIALYAASFLLVLYVTRHLEPKFQPKLIGTAGVITAGAVMYALPPNAFSVQSFGAGLMFFGLAIAFIQFIK